MSDLKPGQRFKSAVCTAEVMVIKVDGDAAITCGGAPMLGPDATPSDAAQGDSEQMTGCEVGKRYVDAEQTLELLCVKAGDGTLASSGAALGVKGSKNLPSSD
jgi:hypothetical protein